MPLPILSQSQPQSPFLTFKKSDFFSVKTFLDVMIWERITLHLLFLQGRLLLQGMTCILPLLSEQIGSLRDSLVHIRERNLVPAPLQVAVHALQEDHSVHPLSVYQWKQLETTNFSSPNKLDCKQLYLFLRISRGNTKIKRRSGERVDERLLS